MSDSTQKLFELSIDLLCIAGPDGHFKKINPAFVRTLGWSEAELLSRPFVDFVHPKDVGATLSELSSLIEGRPTISFENRYRCADGSYKHLRWTAQPDHESGLIFAVAHDVSDLETRDRELVEAKERAEAADAAKSIFLANISHEIRTPMNGIIGMLELALASASDPRARHYMQTIRQSADSLLALIGDLLDVSRAQAGRIQLEPEPMGLREVVGGAMKMVAVDAHRKNLELVHRVDPRVPEALLGDPLRLRQVLVNLLSNGVKFTDSGEVRLDVDLASSEGRAVRLQFRVRDTGVGIPADKHQVIFDTFTQADGSTTRRYGGTGLGLAICRDLVKLMDGTLTVESVEGEGSAFTFDSLFERLPAQLRNTTPIGLANRRVIVVDDSLTQRDLLVDQLGRWRAVVIPASGGEDAWTEISGAAERNELPDLVLVDAAMPGMSGLRLATRIHQRWPQLPVVLMLTSVSAADELRKAEAAGVRAFVMKPFRGSELRNALLFALDLDTTDLTGGQEAVADPLSILIVEDNVTNQEVAAGLLLSRGHRVEVAENGRQGVERFNQGAYDRVLMDVNMPELDGIEATRVIRSLPGKGRTVPIIAMTAHPNGENRELCMAAGMSDYLSKPLRARELFAILEGPGPVDSGEISGIVKVPPGLDAFDAAGALSAVNGNHRLLKRVAEAALREVPGMLGDLAGAACESDLVALRNAAHRLKGSVGVFSTADSLLSIEELEQKAREGDIDRALELARQVPETVEQVLVGVRTILGHAVPSAEEDSDEPESSQEGVA